VKILTSNCSRIIKKELKTFIINTPSFLPFRQKCHPF